MTAMTTGTPRRNGKGYLVAAGGALTALAVVVGAGLRQGTQEQQTFTTTAPSVNAPAPVSRPAPITPSQTRTVYLIDSQATADWQRTAMQEADAIRASMGLPPMDMDFILVTSPEQEAAVTAGLDNADAIRDSLGLPPFSVVDLRIPQARAGSVCDLDGPLPDYC
jgi:hypothetical protein